MSRSCVNAAINFGSWANQATRRASIWAKSPTTRDEPDGAVTHDRKGPTLGKFWGLPPAPEPPLYLWVWIAPENCTSKGHGPVLLIAASLAPLVSRILDFAAKRPAYNIGSTFSSSLSPASVLEKAGMLLPVLGLV